jgi:hypothetical protein
VRTSDPVSFFGGVTMKFLLVFTLSLCLIPIQGFAQETQDDSTSFQRLLDRFLGAEKLHISLITQAGFSIVDDGSNTQSQFDKLEFRLYMKGKISPQFSYYSQVKATSTSSAAILDLRLTYSPIRNFFLDIGKFKIPFSKEYLRGQNELSFVRLSSVGQNLGLGRDQGLQARANMFESRLSGSLAVFNGGTTIYPLNVSVVSARIFVIPFHTLHDFDGFRCELGGSFVYASQRGDFWDMHDYPHKRFWSTDLRLQYDRLWIEGEGGWMYANEGLDRVMCAGSAGYFVAKEYELVARFNFDEVAAYDGYPYFEPIRLGREYTFGINWYPEADVKLQVNYVRDQSQSSNAALLNFQYTINHD